ncbi:hypothetical protein [Candidatus Avelusimicrobium stercoris]|uniref:hypothetical protein n=1 Tax=Candidatus Avelusimicrobium stercoris TaxID=1947924 RepID=UPI003D0B7763
MQKTISLSLCLFLLGSLCAPVCAQRIKISPKKIKTHTTKIQTRVKGADISKYSLASQGWAQTYKLNQKFLNSLKTVPATVSSIHPNLPPRMSAHYKGLSSNMEASIQKNLTSNFAWINQQPNLGENFLKEVNGREIGFRFYKKLSETNVVFVGEIHGNLPPRVEFANLIKEFKTFYPNRRIVVFSEAAYLKPVAGESVFPYQYYRRGAEGVEAPVNFAEKGNPNARLVDDESLKFKEMFSILSDSGVEIYPIEDAVVVQKESAQGIISTVNGLAERNKGFARTMQAQMEKIRQENPDALFIYYGGMAHTSWAMPVSLPKFFAKEKPLVVELIAEKDIDKTFSLLPAVWEKGHPAFTKTGTKRMFLWDSPADQLAAWGKKTGFDCRIVIP